MTLCEHLCKLSVLQLHCQTETGPAADQKCSALMLSVTVAFYTLKLKHAKAGVA